MVAKWLPGHFSFQYFNFKILFEKRGLTHEKIHIKKLYQKSKKKLGVKPMFGELLIKNATVLCEKKSPVRTAFDLATTRVAV